MKTFCDFQEVKNQLNVTIIEIRRLLREGKLLKNVIGGCSLISWESIHIHILHRLSKTPNGYFTVKQVVFVFKIKKEIIESAIVREELKTKKFRGGTIIEKQSLWRWLKVIRACPSIKLDFMKKKNKQIKTKIKVKNTLGIHLRPSGDISEIALIYLPNTTLKLTNKGTTVAGDDVYGIAELCMSYNEWLSVEISGPYADHLLFDLKGAFDHFCQYEKETIPECKYDLAAIKRDFERYG